MSNLPGTPPLPNFPSFGAKTESENILIPKPDDVDKLPRQEPSSSEIIAAIDDIKLTYPNSNPSKQINDSQDSGVIFFS